jgi:hypothetical protein
MPSKSTSEKLKKLSYLKDHLLSINSQIVGIEGLYILPLGLKTERKGIARLIKTTSQLLARIEKRIEILETHGKLDENSAD